MRKGGLALDTIFGSGRNLAIFAERLDDLAAVPGNRFEALAGDRQGKYSIRLNQQYRITFRWENHYAHDVRCEDYH